jgi:uncharacterized protein YegL
MSKVISTPEGHEGKKSSKKLKFFWLVDVSGSMMGNKIKVVNRAIREVLPAIKKLEVKEELKVFMGTITFGSRAEWLGADDLVELSQFNWNDIDAIASDRTSTAQAIELLCSALDVKNIGGRSVPPVCILLSDGYCTDSEEEYNMAIKNLDLHSWGSKAIRLSIGIGERGNYNKEQLDQFILPHLRDKGVETLSAMTSRQLVKHIRTTSTLAAEGAEINKEDIEDTEDQTVEDIYDALTAGILPAPDDKF